jgi:imidazolonepropionase-like amidohydrolase
MPRPASGPVPPGTSPHRKSATTVAADLLGIGGKTGAIQSGFEADLIVVEKNPLQDARALADVLVVISNGRVALNRLPFAK